MSQNAKGHKRIKLHSPQKIINYIHEGQRRHTKYIQVNTLHEMLHTKYKLTTINKYTPKQVKF